MRRPKSSRPKMSATVPLVSCTFVAKSRGWTAIRANRFSLAVAMPDVPTMRSAPSIAASKSAAIVASSRMSTPCIARCRASLPRGHGFTSARSEAPKFFIARATAPTLPSFFGSTRTTRTRGMLVRYIIRKISLGMRVALKIAYDGRAFYGHQRQPDRRTVEGECITALRSAKIMRDPTEAFFRSASRTDRGVSAVGNVIAFDAFLGPDSVLGAFNDRARDVWAWAAAAVPASFHPRHAMERWYRYVLFGDVVEPDLRAAARSFIGTHNFQAFCSEPVVAPSTTDGCVAAPRPFGIRSAGCGRDTRTLNRGCVCRSFRRSSCHAARKRCGTFGEKIAQKR